MTALSTMCACGHDVEHHHLLRAAVVTKDPKDGRGRGQFLAYTWHCEGTHPDGRACACARWSDADGP
jgi:hypothetical protein